MDCSYKLESSIIIKDVNLSYNLEQSILNTNNNKKTKTKKMFLVLSIQTC